ncbi:MAG: hypothetical protein JSS81_04005 [Acidobacteria bacterium]|nr:hypothetical protein [Acidobacteriota bacterium]
MHSYKLLLLICCLLTITGLGLAQDIRPEAYGAIVNDNIDDTPAVQAAIDAVLEEGGGTVVFPSGRLNITRTIRVIPNGYVGGEIKLQGNRGSVLDFSMGTSGYGIYAGNLNSLNIEDLVITGKRVEPGQPGFYDANYVVFSNYVNQTNITRCQFYGLAVPSGSAIVYVGNTDARIADSQFDGDLGAYPEGAVILADNPRGLTVTRCTFLDYANFNGQYYSKASGFVGSWIKVRGNPEINDANGIRRVLIEDSRFDEGAATAVNINSVPWVDISGISINVNGSDYGRGVFLKNVEYAKVQESWFGWTVLTRPALDLENVGGLEVTALKFGGGVYFVRQQNPVEMTVKFCPQCN